ncbi:MULTISPECIES: alpha/beta hydrolase [unclassified Kitasatospora]|uniref:alpha/beta hydrolase family protein n=1 Tax=unclassified Kitasatospora TaxID=2633591 RepID=UPI0034053B29
MTMQTHGPARSVTATLLAAAAVGALAGAAPAPANRGFRGEVVSVVPVSDLGTAQTAAFLAGMGVDAAGVKYGVRGYRITYRTITPQGGPTTATGLLVLPQDGRHGRLDLVSDTHGTMVNRADAPSAGQGFGRLSPYLQASAGRAVAAPDYLGLGEGPGRHPYMDTESAVSASLDMLRAARTAARGLGRPLTGDVYATGFSQGGQVAAALAKELDRGADHNFRLKALAPVSGPYDVEHAEMPGLLDGSVNPVSGVFYLSYWLTAQNRLHPIYKDPAEVFKQPYAGVVEGLFDGEHQEEEIVSALAPDVRSLVTPEFYDRLGHPDGGLLDAIRLADGTCDWHPRVPVRLYTASGDTDVPMANSLSCAGEFAAKGVQVPVVDQGAVDHFGAFRKSGPQVVRLFDEVAHGSR